MRFLKNWFRDEEGMAAVESALIFPILLTLLLGVFDLGNGILANQKTIRASQVTADLITRNRSVDDAAIDDAIEAGRLAYEPMDSTSFGIDVVSISFDDEANAQIVWRETRNMAPMSNVLEDVAALAEPGNGVLVVGVQYDFEPVFAGFVVNTIEMEERAFSRGRKSAVVTKD